MAVQPKLVDHTDVHQALANLCDGFGSPADGALDCEAIAPESLPASYQRLLVHHAHMTSTLREYHGLDVCLRVLEYRDDGEFYRRMILLTAGETGPVVEFGVVRLALSHLDKEVRSAIIERKTPLGDLFNRHEVLTRVEPKWFVRYPRGGVLAEAFGPKVTGELYGRLGTIYCNGQPAVELLEVVTDARARSEAL